MGICRFLWAQKGPSMLHAVTMTLVGLKVALQKDWMPRDLAGGHNELVSAFLALELAYLVQVRLELHCSDSVASGARGISACLGSFNCTPIPARLQSSIRISVLWTDLKLRLYCILYMRMLPQMPVLCIVREKIELHHEFSPRSHLQTGIHSSCAGPGSGGDKAAALREEHAPARMGASHCAADWAALLLHKAPV